MLCQVYRSPRKAEMYLYVQLGDDLSRVPATLLQHFGEPEAVLQVHLDGTRELARADAAEVVEQIREQGYFLQMPPGPEDFKRKPE